jgi:hypothetical protein
LLEKLSCHLLVTFRWYEPALQSGSANHSFLQLSVEKVPSPGEVAATLLTRAEFNAAMVRRMQHFKVAKDTVGPATENPLWGCQRDLARSQVERTPAMTLSI